MSTKRTGHPHLGGVPGETGCQDDPRGTFEDAGAGRTIYEEGAQTAPEPRWHGGYHDHGYNPGVEEGGSASADPTPVPLPSPRRYGPPTPITRQAVIEQSERAPGGGASRMQEKDYETVKQIRGAMRRGELD